MQVGDQAVEDEGPSRQTWIRMLGWEALLVCQVILALIGGGIATAAAYVCIAGLQALLKKLEVGGTLVNALETLKGIGMLVVFVAYEGLKLVNIWTIHVTERRRASEPDIKK